MFYVTNTKAETTLINTSLEFSSDVLVNVAGNETNNWGTPGSNGGEYTLTAANQTLEGAVQCDEISTVLINLTDDSSYKGAVNTEKTAKSAGVNMDSTSTWELTADSYLETFTNEQGDCSNIQSNGFNIYYNAQSNAWLNGQTIELAGGGKLMPMA